MRSPACNLVLAALVIASPAAAQDRPADHAGVLKVPGKTGDFKGGVLKVDIPRNDLPAAIDGTLVPTPSDGTLVPPPRGFGGWIALAKADHKMDVMMGDLVLTVARGVRAAVDRLGK